MLEPCPILFNTIIGHILIHQAHQRGIGIILINQTVFIDNCWKQKNVWENLNLNDGHYILNTKFDSLRFFRDLDPIRFLVSFRSDHLQYSIKVRDFFINRIRIRHNPDLKLYDFWFPYIVVLLCEINHVLISLSNQQSICIFNVNALRIHYTIILYIMYIVLRVSYITANLYFK